MGRCEACYTRERRARLKGYTPRTSRDKRYWTKAERDYARMSVGIVSIPRIAKHLGRTTSAVLTFFKEEGINIHSAAARMEGMSTGDVCAALGVSRSTLLNWIRAGYIHPIKHCAAEAWYYSYSWEEVLRFLNERGGLHPLDPDEDWKPLYNAARTRLLQRYIGIAEMCKILCIAENSVSNWRQRYGFPNPVFNLNAHGGTYYERTAVRAWLDRHEDRWTSAARERL